MPKTIVCVGAVYIDTILSVPRFPKEDEKLRAAGHSRRRGGNCANTLEVLSQLTSQREHAHPENQVTLHLLAVLPAEQSPDVRFVEESLLNVHLGQGCIFREAFENAASSYIIQAAETNSRTIVSHNPLPEMTTQEFIDRATAVWRLDRAGGHWFHFEGRIPVVTGESVSWLREQVPRVKISVECEKPERAYMARVSTNADVVFYSKLWAETNGYHDPRSFLEAQLPSMRPGAILVCTWGSSGATCVQNNQHEPKEHEWASVPAWKPATGRADVVDTIGAGDTFIAGFLYAMNCHQAWALQRKLEFANEIAGRKVLQDGFEGLAEAMRSFSATERGLS